MAARAHADEEAVSAALRFAERRKIGPFALERSNDRREQERALAAMIRAGHGFALARAIVRLAPGAAIDLDDLASARGLPAIKVRFPTQALVLIRVVVNASVTLAEGEARVELDPGRKSS